MNDEQQNPQGIENQIPEETRVPEEQTYIPEETKVPDSTITPEQQAISSEQPIEAPKVPQEVEEVIKESTPSKDIYIPTEETKGNNLLIYVVILVLIAAAVGVAIYIFTHKKNDTTGVTTGVNSIDLNVNSQNLGGYIINLPEKYKISEKEDNRLVLTNYIDKVQLSFEINNDYTIDEYQDYIDPIKDSFKTGYGLKDLLYSHKKFESKDWFILESSDTDGFNYTLSFTDLNESTVSIITISQISDYSGIYKELSAIVSGIRKIATPKEEPAEEEDKEKETNDDNNTTKKPGKKPSKSSNNQENNTNTENNNPSNTEEPNTETNQPTQNDEENPSNSGPKPFNNDVDPNNIGNNDNTNTEPPTNNVPANDDPKRDEDKPADDDGKSDPNLGPNDTNTNPEPTKPVPRRAPEVPLMERPNFATE
jgi:hypothetical protein